MQRKLAAILAADVVGYSRLIGLDEQDTLRILMRLRRQFVEPAIERHGGRIVKLMGDGLLAEFSSVVAAVTAAVEILEALPSVNADRPQDRNVALRIGVNIGDVVEQDGDIFGDGVNVAARLESIAPSNGMAISDASHREIQGKLALQFEDSGEQSLKNIAQPLRVWVWPATSLEKQEGPAENHTATSNRASIAVLPFENLSSDPDQEFLADGMAEDIISGLSKFHWLLVIARRSSFTFKGKSTDVRDIARQLGVRYVVEGSIRHAGSRIRVTAQLIDAEAGVQIWTYRADRSLDEIFELQDELSESIIAQIAPEISQAEVARFRRVPPENLDAWGHYQRGLALAPSGALSDFEESIRLFDKAVELDPNFVDALAMAAHLRMRKVFFFGPKNSDEILRDAEELLQNGLRLDRRNSTCHMAMGRLLGAKGDYQAAVSECREAVDLNPNSVYSYRELALALQGLRRWEEAIGSYDMIQKLSPKDPQLASVYTGRAFNFLQLGRYEDSVESARIALRSPNPRYWCDAWLIAALTHLNRTEEVSEAKQQLLQRKPDFRISEFQKLPWANYAQDLFPVLRRAGLPE